MKKVLLWIAVAILIIHLVTGYHATPEGAFEELQQSTDATLIPLVDEGHVILLDENGGLSIALMITERGFLVTTLYTDFETFPTNLNVFDVDLDHTIAFLNAPGNWEHAYGLVKSEEVKYLASSWPLEYEDPLTVHPLADYILDSAAEDLVLWDFPQELEKDTLQSSFYFLDANETLIERIKNDYRVEEFFVSEDS
ncbi:hypothetical protein [Planococcus sp. ISL-110]|uniref:hypothetical protein n=1 Tax=Planococcus sp. ISL-110 TaxID=2819167 RepID=UPI001BE9ABE3|nr:hypothetical protein [Planococcus sp. ISL-110]MBT2570028.1 hypothetical protein [Planococcus sp. ISL-110]